MAASRDCWEREAARASSSKPTSVAVELAPVAGVGGRAAVTAAAEASASAFSNCCWRRWTLILSLLERICLQWGSLEEYMVVVRVLGGDDGGVAVDGVAAIRLGGKVARRRRFRSVAVAVAGIAGWGRRSCFVAVVVGGGSWRGESCGGAVAVAVDRGNSANRCSIGKVVRGAIGKVVRGARRVEAARLGSARGARRVEAARLGSASRVVVGAAIEADARFGSTSQVEAFGSAGAAVVVDVCVLSAGLEWRRGFLLEVVGRLDPPRSCWGMVSGKDAGVVNRGESDRAVPAVACACVVVDAAVDVAGVVYVSCLKLSHVGRRPNFPRDWGCMRDSFGRIPSSTPEHAGSFKNNRGQHHGAVAGRGWCGRALRYSSAWEGVSGTVAAAVGSEQET